MFGKKLNKQNEVYSKKSECLQRISKRSVLISQNFMSYKQLIRERGLLLLPPLRVNFGQLSVFKVNIKLILILISFVTLNDWRNMQWPFCDEQLFFAVFIKYTVPAHHSIVFSVFFCFVFLNASVDYHDCCAFFDDFARIQRKTIERTKKMKCTAIKF